MSKEESVFTRQPINVRNAFTSIGLPERFYAEPNFADKVTRLERLSARISSILTISRQMQRNVMDEISKSSSYSGLAALLPFPQIGIFPQNEYLKKKNIGGSDQILKSRHPRDEILQNSVRVSVTNC